MGAGATVVCDGWDTRGYGNGAMVLCHGFGWGRFGNPSCPQIRQFGCRIRYVEREGSVHHAAQWRQPPPPAAAEQLTLSMDEPGDPIYFNHMDTLLEAEQPLSVVDARPRSRSPRR